MAATPNSLLDLTLIPSMTKPYGYLSSPCHPTKPNTSTFFNIQRQNQPKPFGNEKVRIRITISLQLLTISTIPLFPYTE